MTLTAAPADSSPCYTCKSLDYCAEILWTLEDLPCMGLAPKTVDCELCGKTVLLNNKRRRFCSTYCRNKAYKMRTKKL